MKKTLSMILVLSMVLSLALPIGVLAEGVDPNAGLYDSIKTKFSNKIIVGPDTAKKSIQKLNDYGFLRKLSNSSSTALNNYNALKEHLNTVYGLDNATINSIIDIFTEWSKKENYGKLQQLFDDIKNGKASSESADSVAYIGELRTRILGAHSSLIDKWNDFVLLESQKENKTGLVFDFYDAILKNMKVEEKSNRKNLNFSIKDDVQLKADIQALETKYLKCTKLNDDMNYIAAIKELVEVVEKEYNAFVNTLGSSSPTIVKSILTGLGVKYVEYTPSTPVEPTTPSTGGGGASGGGTTTPSTPTINVDVPSDTSKEVTAEIGKNSMTIETKGDTAVVTIKEADAVKTVEDLRKAAGENREASLRIIPEGIKDENSTISIPANVVNDLANKDVNLEIIVGGIEYNIPHTVLDGISISKGESLEIVTEKVQEEVLKDVVKEEQNLKKVVEISLVIKENGKTTKVSEFKIPVVVKIDVKGQGNYDKLAVYFFNEEGNELKFVAGKIKDNNIVMRLNHFSKYVLIESNITFDDVTNHWAKVYVESMAAKNVIGGYGNGKFGPNDNITRAQFAKMVVGALESELVKYNGEFNDVKVDAWYADYVATVKKLGIAGGYGDGTFKPEQEITRTEMAAMLSKVSNVEVTDDEIEKLVGKFTDATPQWAREAVAKVVKAELMIGDGNKFNANRNTTRAEAATTVYRLYNK